MRGDVFASMYLQIYCTYWYVVLYSAIFFMEYVHSVCIYCIYSIYHTVQYSILVGEKIANFFNYRTFPASTEACTALEQIRIDALHGDPL
jgi:hypothetical protein